MLLPSILRCLSTATISAWLGTWLTCTCISSGRCLARSTWALLWCWLCWLGCILWLILLWLLWGSSLLHLWAHKLRYVTDGTKHVTHHLIHLRSTTWLWVGARATGCTTTSLSWWWSHKTLQKVLNVWWHTLRWSTRASRSTTHSTHHLGKYSTKIWRTTWTTCMASWWWEWEPRWKAWWWTMCSSTWWSSRKSWWWTSWSLTWLKTWLLTWLGSAWSSCIWGWGLISWVHLSLCWLLNDVDGLHVFRYIIA